MNTETPDFAQIIATTTTMVLEQLTDEEAIAFNLFLLLDGKNPTSNLAWPKVEPLFQTGNVISPEVHSVALAYLQNRISQLTK